MRKFERASGVLLHPSSLPSHGGIGDFGPAAYEFVDFLASARQHLWQILPLAPVGVGNSPYSATSAFAGNPLLVSLQRLAERGWISPDRLRELPAEAGAVDFARVKAAKGKLLREAAQNFLDRDFNRQRFEGFVNAHREWLESFVLFDALRARFGEVSWKDWPREFAAREPGAMERARREMERELAIGRVIQFAFFEQWYALRRYCARHGIRVIGDVAIFVSFDSADVWSHPEIFRLKEDLDPEVVAGVPPDAFSATGQRWGNPLYRWDKLRERGYDWWIQRLRWALESCDYIRLDHFRGFESYWEIPASEPTAVNGRWIKGPGEELFHALRHALGELPFIAEDLGLITADVHALRERLQVPGMRVLQFAFGDRGAHIYLPHRFEPHTVVYTGTHDNDTTVGWWQTAQPHERRAAEHYFGSLGEGIHWAMIRAALASVAEFCVIPAQDWLGLDGTARMNTPSKPDGNWNWRLPPKALTPKLANKLAALAEVTDRDQAFAPDGAPYNPADYSA